ncbi:Nif3-like dinuclear metal center hexameric protein [Chryseotalea sanaruensis]|uniref:GTP cyclohydrolase 1 type 2 homolog n=1 Tax=Chryseotalea sanaruensis TaxID=2482724 RepID=A0A401U8Z5_9BACT|nr:Nif3-like dinuclear metal center hexameric protein [Chryseotalea sanaruensis]GCC51355.1 Nif3-like dinuclear metal center hexameric protein [Chryseotalea sanaruensis]
MKIKEVINYLESIAPRAYQEPYDNSGLLTGNADNELSNALITLDCTEEVVQEAIDKKCNLIIAHHPIVFKGLKKLTGSNYVERTIISAIKNDIAIYAIHTNLDNVNRGVNKKIAEKLGLQNVRILLPKQDSLSKLVTFIPQTHANEVLSALHDAGAGQIGNYKNCSFIVEGTGSFQPNEMANPNIGEAGKQEKVDEIRAEVIFPNHLEKNILKALKQSHPYEEVAYYISSLHNENQEVGSGMIGELPESLEPKAFLAHLKKSMALKVIRHTPLVNRNVKKIALCGGSGSFLLKNAIQAGADFYVSADFKYHEFFDAENRLTIADIGHYESEVYTKDLIGELLTKKFPTFAVNFSGTITNPISYYL